VPRHHLRSHEREGRNTIFRYRTATLATFATVPTNEPRTVADVASVAASKAKTSPLEVPSVATVASVRGENARACVGSAPTARPRPRQSPADYPVPPRPDSAPTLLAQDITKAILDGMTRKGSNARADEGPLAGPAPAATRPIVQPTGRRGLEATSKAAGRPSPV
jgi:hypothetical protein